MFYSDGSYLENHPSQWLMTMVIVSPCTHRVVGPLPNGRILWLINGGDPNHLRPSWDDAPRRGDTEDIANLQT